MFHHFNGSDIRKQKLPSAVFAGDFANRENYPHTPYTNRLGRAPIILQPSTDIIPSMIAHKTLKRWLQHKPAHAFSPIGCTVLCCVFSLKLKHFASEDHMKDIWLASPGWLRPGVKRRHTWRVVIARDIWLLARSADFLMKWCFKALQRLSLTISNTNRLRLIGESQMLTQI